VQSLLLGGNSCPALDTEEKIKIQWANKSIIPDGLYTCNVSALIGYIGFENGELTQAQVHSVMHFASSGC